MRKEFTLLLGRRGGEIKELVSEFSKILGIEFQKRDSHFSDAYYAYSGDQSDRIRIELNFNSAVGDWSEEKFKDYSLLIHISNSEGKNVEKEMRMTRIKNLLTQIPNVEVLRENVYES